MGDTKMNRRNLVKGMGVLAAGAALDTTLVELSFGAQRDKNFTFAYISDSHLQQIKGTKFVRNWDRGLIRAVAETNLLSPKPDFVVYGGDLAQLGKREEIDHGLEIMSALRYDVKWVLGEHDYYLDMGEYWADKVSEHFYSWDHKGVHFITLKSIVVDEAWSNKWSSPEERMGVMAGLDDPRGAPFMVGAAQRKWLADDLAAIPKDTPIVVFSHSPLQKIFKNWNFWTDDAELIQGMFAPFDKVTIFYGHVHQIQYNQIGNMSFHSVMSTAWPWPYPRTLARNNQYVPKLTVPMNRADPFHERDATGWQYIDIWSGHATENFILTDNRPRSVAFNEALGRPEDKGFSSPELPSQHHY
ncbi:MAG TPA: serine/threonine protein phosphatase [Hellea balneolensis]|uniref:Serine/threonine protein phosphatase n=1 Tax=Hellea balneolensis TaxID=287478 RepID=A0A7C3C2C0_9PROT|nr:serine/threonine protein phosphatase [Hellea balneolensis]